MSGRLEGPCFTVCPVFGEHYPNNASRVEPSAAIYIYVQHSHLFTSKDKMLAAGEWNGAGVAVDVNQNPISWSSTGHISCTVYQDVIGYYDVVKSGNWVVKYKDAFHAGTTSATTSIALISGGRRVTATGRSTVSDGRRRRGHDYDPVDV